MQLIESATLLSESRLWNWLKQLYAQEGLNAWQGVGTPFYLTSTPRLAAQWAQLAFDFFCQHYLPGHEPWTLIEIGAGCGRFAYLFLQRFDQLHRRYFEHRGLAPHPWRYVLLDLSPPIFDFWLNHPYLAPYWQRGCLDYGYCDLSSDQPIMLQLAGKPLAHLQIPCVTIGNYLFDTLPAEAFLCAERQVVPLQWQLEAPIDESGDDARQIELLLTGLRYHWSPAPTSRHALSRCPDIAQLFDHYLEQLPTGHCFTISSGALACIERLRRIAPGILLLAADQGFGEIEELKAHRQVELGRHGTVSCPVNYDALARLLNAQGHPCVLSSTASHKFVQMAAFLDRAALAVHTIEMAQDSLEQFDNENYWRLVDQLLAQPLPATAAYLLLKLGEWDPINCFHMLPLLEPHLPSFTALERARWLAAFEKVATLFYPIAAGDCDLLGKLAEICVKLSDWKLAAQIWERSLLFAPARADLQFNLALAYYQIGDKAKSMEHFVRAEQLDPSYSLQSRGWI